MLGPPPQAIRGLHGLQKEGGGRPASRPPETHPWDVRLSIPPSATPRMQGHAQSLPLQHTASTHFQEAGAMPVSCMPAARIPQLPHSQDVRPCPNLCRCRTHLPPVPGMGRHARILHGCSPHSLLSISKGHAWHVLLQHRSLHFSLECKAGPPATWLQHTSHLHSSVLRTQSVGSQHSCGCSKCLFVYLSGKFIPGIWRAAMSVPSAMLLQHACFGS